MVKKFLLILILMVLMPLFVNGQEQSVTTQLTSVFTRENFKTKEELKTLIEDKSLEYNLHAESMISEGLEEVKSSVYNVGNLLLFKFMLGIFSIILFSGGVQYFIRLKLDQRKIKIMGLIASKPTPTPTPQTEEKPLKQADSKPESKKAKKKRIKADIKEIKQSLKESEEKNKREYEDFKRWRSNR